MLSFYRSGLLALTLVSGYIANADAQTQRIAHESWVSDISIERLQDSSVLTEYFGEATSNEYPEVIFRVGFIPRFGCAPLITFKFGRAVGDDLLGTALQRDAQFLSVSIDGVKLTFPAVIDEDSDFYSIYMNASLQRRITAKLKIEIGNALFLRLANEQPLSFSLLGSRDAISIANQNCRRHDPSQQQ